MTEAKIGDNQASDDSFNEQAKSYEKLKQSISSGFVEAGARYAGPSAQGKPTAAQTIKASLGTGLTASIFGGLSVNEGDFDPDYDVKADLRPGDERYLPLFIKSPNLEETQRIQHEIDQRDEYLRIQSERPFVAFGGHFLDPLSLGVDIATYGLGRAVSIPFLANAARRTEIGLQAANALKNAPRTARAIEEGARGVHANVASIYGSTQIKVATNELEDDEALGEHLVMGSLIGLALGGAVGLIGTKGTKKITEDFTQAQRVGGEAAHAPPEFTGPPRPSNAELGILSTGERPNIRAEAEATKKLTPEEVRTAAIARRAEVDAELPQRASAYAALRKQFTQIGENLNKNPNVPKIVNKALSLVTAPYRNMSASNRLLSAPFGSGRLFVMGMVRNATEFAGTREGLVLPRSAQNRMEDIGNHALDVSLDIQKMYLEANKVSPGAFASERLLLGERIYDEEAFFRDVGTQMLHIGRPTQNAKNVNPTVQKAAAHAYKEFYKPMGDLLKEYGLIAEDSAIEETLNYLNRLYKTDRIIQDPEGFKGWLANVFDEQNDELKSLLPAYEQNLKNARELNRDASRFEKAADEIDNLVEKVERDEIQTKIAQTEATRAEKSKRASETYEAQKANIVDKYDEIRTRPDAEIPAIAPIKKSLKEEIRSALDEQKSLLKDYHNDRSRLQAEIKSERNIFKEQKRSILKGNRDYEIKQQMADKFIAEYSEHPEYSAYSLDEVKKIATKTFGELDNATLKRLRQIHLNDYRIKTINAIDEHRSKIYSLDKEIAQLESIFKSDLQSEVTSSLSELEKASKKIGKISAGPERLRILESREKLELQLIDLKEKHAQYKIDMAAHKEQAKLSEPINRLEYLQKKYSRAGLEAFYTRKATERSFPTLKSQARALERGTIAKITPSNDARIIAEELREGATIETQRAEDIIPDRLRSNTTGQPRRTYDKDLEPTYAYERADQTMMTILGQEDEIVFNPVLTTLGGGTPSMFKPRNIKIPDDYPGLEQWVERDIRVLMDNFGRGVAPPVALTELKNQLNEMPIIRQTVKRMNLARNGLSDRQLIEAPDTIQHYSEIPGVLATMMREEYRLMSEGLTGKPLDDLLRQYQAAEREMKTIFQQVKGVFGQGLNINSSDISDFISLFNSAASTVTTTNIVISMMSELMTPSLRYGFKKYINETLAPLLSSAELRNMSKQELKAMHLTTKVAQGAIIKNKISGRPNSLKNSTVGRFFSNLSNRLGNVTGANHMQESNEIMTAILVKNNLLLMSEKAANGTATANEITHLAQRSISPEKAKRINELWKKYGWEKEGVRGIDPSKLSNMSPEDAKAWADYTGFVNDDLKTIIAKPGIGSLPNYSYTPMGGAILYLKKYFFAATNDVLIPAAQRADKNAVQGFSGLFAMGALQSEIRKLYRDEERKPFNLESFIVEALTNSAIPGIYSFGVDIASASGIIAGAGGARYDPSGGLAAYITGPGVIGLSGRTLGILAKLRKIATDEDKQFTYKEFNAMANTYVPLYKWAPIASVVKPNVREYFESIGRGGE